MSNDENRAAGKANKRYSFLLCTIIQKKEKTHLNLPQIFVQKNFTNRLVILCANYNYTEIFFVICLHIKTDQILKLFKILNTHFFIFHINILVNAMLGYQRKVIWLCGVRSMHFYKF